MMRWETLLCSSRLGRLGKGTAGPMETHRSPFQRDFDRIVFSSAFRRMQDKTQVFPLAESDYVRTRLTHSLEAACVGRSLGTHIGARVVERHGLRHVHPSDIGAIVAAACLAHDIGNPPFGHSGEDGIRHWFATSPVARSLSERLTPAQRHDFERFEGNAQGFRILTRLQMPDNEGGLQLTCATLAAFAKYPVASDTPAELRGGAGSKKFSFFLSESPLFAEVAGGTGMLRRSGDAACWARHPLAFLVEAADDICYRLVDFEDGVRLGILSGGEVSHAFSEVIGKPDALERAARLEGQKEQIEMLRAMAIGTVVDQAAEVFLAHETEILAGTFDRPLIDCAPAAEALAKIQRRSMETIYVSPRGLEIEAAGFEVIGGLLDLFVQAVEDEAAGRKGGRSRTLLRLVPDQFIGKDRRIDPDPYPRLQRITDFVAGMTDSYAVALYRKLRGISLPGQR